jgi:hypothetical protein
MTNLTREAFASTTLAKSDQINSADLIGSPLVCQITDIRMTGAADQPIAIHVDAHPQPWKPSKTSRRVLLACWPDTDPSEWIGRWIVLYNDESVMWAGKAEGGIRMSHCSHIDREVTVSVNATRGKKAPQRVQPYYPQADQQAPAEVVYWPDDAFAKKLEGARLKLESGEMTADQVIAALEKKAPITAGQRARIDAIKPVQPEPISQEDDLEPPPRDDEDFFAEG